MHMCGLCVFYRDSAHNYSSHRVFVHQFGRRAVYALYVTVHTEKQPAPSCTKYGLCWVKPMVRNAVNALLAATLHWSCQKAGGWISSFYYFPNSVEAPQVHKKFKFKYVCCPLRRGPSNTSLHPKWQWQLQLHNVSSGRLSLSLWKKKNRVLSHFPCPQPCGSCA